MGASYEHGRRKCRGLTCPLNADGSVLVQDMANQDPFNVKTSLSTPCFPPFVERKSQNEIRWASDLQISVILVVFEEYFFRQEPTYQTIAEWNSILSWRHYKFQLGLSRGTGPRASSFDLYTLCPR